MLLGSTASGERLLMEGSSKGRYRVKSKERRKSFKLLNPYIKIEILIYYPYTFSIEVGERIC